MVDLPPLPLCAALFLGACAGPPLSKVHARNAIGIRGLYAEDLQSDRPDPADPEGGVRGVRNASAFGFHFENFFNASQSAWADLERHSDPGPSVAGRSLQLRTGLRQYWFPESRWQPFFGGGFLAGLLDSGAQDGLVWIGGLTAHTGLAWFPTRGLGLELGFAYSYWAANPHDVDTPSGTRIRSDETLNGFEGTLQLSVFF